MEKKRKFVKAAIILVCLAAVIFIIVQDVNDVKYSADKNLQVGDKASYQFNQPSLYGKMDLNLTAQFYSKANEEWQKDNNAAQLISLSNIVLKTDSSQGDVRIEFIPLKTGELRYVIFANGKEVLNNEQTIDAPSLYRIIKNLVVGFVWIPLLVSVFSPILLVKNHLNITDYYQNGLNQFCDKLGIPVSEQEALITAVMAVLMLISIVLFAIKNYIDDPINYKHERNLKTEINIQLLGISAGVLCTFLIWIGNGYLFDVLMCSKIDVYYAIGTWALAHFLSLIKSIADIKSRKIKPFKYVSALIGAVLTFIFLHAPLIGIIILLVCVAFAISKYTRSGYYFKKINERIVDWIFGPYNEKENGNDDDNSD